MLLEWTKHLDNDPEAKQEFIELLRHSRKVLDRLQEICRSNVEGLDRVESSVKDFDSNSWPYKQAYRNGVRATLRQFIQLLDQKENKK